MLWTRVATAAIGIPLALAVIWVGGWPLAAAISVIAVLGLREFDRLLGVRGPATTAAAIIGVAAVGAAVVAGGLGHLLLALPVALGVLLAVHPPFPARGSGVWRRGLAALAGVLYVGVPLAGLLVLRGTPVGLRWERWQLHIAPGAVWVFFALAVCWVTDAAAYLVGRKVGRHKLAPRISPGKTVEGAAAGLLGAALFGLAMGRWFGFEMGLLQAALLGTSLGVMGQLGDLFESWLKRRAGVKDSGALLPGHGGVLDRFDSLLFVVPTLYLWLWFLPY